MFRSAFLLVLVLLTAGCTHTSGRNFVRPDAAKVELGRTRKADILSLYGRPERQSSAIVTETSLASTNRPKTEFEPAAVPGSYASISYHYTESKPPITGGDVSFRSLNFIFWNDTLIAYNFVSSFSNDSSNFDDAKLSAITKAKTTRAEVFATLGAPTGGAIYPAVLTKGNEKAIYDFAQMAGQPRQLTHKRLEILFDEAGRVLDYRFASTSRPAPVAPAAAPPVMIPIIVPSHK